MELLEIVGELAVCIKNVLSSVLFGTQSERWPTLAEGFFSRLSFSAQC
jgi:hypothetical protein